MAALAATLMIFLLLPQDSTPAPITDHPGNPRIETNQGQISTDRLSRKGLELDSSIQFVDRLDPSLPIPAEAVSFHFEGGSVEAINPSALVEALETHPHDGRWQIIVPSLGRETVLATPVAESGTSIPGTYSLPFRSGMKLDIRDTHGQSTEGKVHARTYILEREGFHLARETGDNLVPDGLWGTYSFDSLLAKFRSNGLEYVYQEFVSSDQEEIYLLEDFGVLLVSASAGGFGHNWVETSLAPGIVTEVQILLPQRPLVFGTARESNGHPLSNELIFIGVSFGSTEAPDISEFDSGEGTSLVAGGLPGSMRRMARLGVRTDDYGQYSIRVPRGEYYSVSGRDKVSYGFSRTSQLDFGQLDRIQLDLDLLSAADFDTPYYLILKDENGTPIEGADIGLGIVDDLDFARHFPVVRTDSSGKASFPWIEEGTLVNPYIHIQGKRVRKGGPYLTLQPGFTTIVVDRVEFSGG